MPPRAWRTNLLAPPISPRRSQRPIGSQRAGSRRSSRAIMPPPAAGEWHARRARRRAGHSGKGTALRRTSPRRKRRRPSRETRSKACCVARIRPLAAFISISRRQPSGRTNPEMSAAPGGAPVPNRRTTTPRSSRTSIAPTFCRQTAHQGWTWRARKNARMKGVSLMHDHLHHDLHNHLHFKKPTSPGKW